MDDVEEREMRAAAAAAATVEPREAPGASLLVKGPEIAEGDAAALRPCRGEARQRRDEAA